MLRRPSSMLLPLLALLPSAAWAAKEASVTKTFKFKEDFFIRFHPLPTAIGPNESVEALMDALEDVAEHFKDTWIEEIESDLQGGECTVNRALMRLPEFSLCDWKYPDRYDVDELPTPGQCYDYGDGFIQRIYYKIRKLEITCPEDFSYDDLDKDAYTAAVFEDDDLLDLLSPPGRDCDGDPLTACLFADAAAAEWSGFDQCTAELYINRYTEVPVYLKCLDTDGYGRGVANKLIAALDEYFELVVSVVLEEKIMERAPEGHVYNFASPYASDRKYCVHGAYYAGGNLVQQVADDDGVLITRFTYGFDVIWYKPKDFDGELFPDLEQMINEAFDDGEFLEFLQEKYPDYDFVQDGIEVCDAIDPDQAEFTFAPTFKPTDSPTEEPACDLDTDDGCDDGQVCRLSCVQASSEPRCYDDEEERDCTDAYGPGWVCQDSDGNGSISSGDHSDGCQYRSPTASPVEAEDTPFPTPAIEDTPFPTPVPVTPFPTESPTLRPVTSAPTVSFPPTDARECDVDSAETCGGDAFCRLDLGACPGGTAGACAAIPERCTERFDPVCGCDGETYSNECKAHAAGVSVLRAGECPEPSRSPTDPPTPSPTEEPSRRPTKSPTLSPTMVPTFGDTETENVGRTLVPSPAIVRPAVTLSPTLSPAEGSAPTTDAPTCPLCIVYPDDTEKDECPIATTGTCADGDRGDGICPYEGYCCSKWGYCGTTSEYCDDDSVAPTPSQVDAAPVAPTYSVDAGQCANGDVGDEFCPDDEHCCSDWGYCGSGESYCYLTSVEASDGTCGGGGVGNGECSSGNCCSEYGFCGEGELYCTGQNGLDLDSDCVSRGEEVIDNSPLPEDLVPEFGFRCGITEVDARGNCKKECTHHVQCEAGEECWGVQLNYCNAFEEGSHPFCTNLTLADEDSRCGFDEAAARGFCGIKCVADADCGAGEYCFPTLLNLCECHEETCPEEADIAFFNAKALVSPYFVQSNPETLEEEGSAEGRPRNASIELNLSIAASLLTISSAVALMV